MSARTYESVSVGDPLGVRELRLRRADLVRYAGASLDTNPIHWNEAAAREADLPGVIAHGMLTMALAGTLITTWAGTACAIVEFTTRFIRPIVVPNDEDGAIVEISGKVGAKRDDNTVRVTVAARCAGVVVGRSTALVTLPAARPASVSTRRGELTGSALTA